MKNFTLRDLIILVVVIVFMIAIVAGMYTPALGGAYEKARRISCASQLKSMGVALFMYANDYNKVFPSGTTSNSVATTLTAKAGGLNRLIFLNYLSDTAIYNCPSAVTLYNKPSINDVTAAKDGNTITTLATERTCSYVYAPGLMTGTSNIYGNPDSAIVADMTSIASKRPTGNHNRYGNILFQGLHVKGYSGSNQEDWFLLNYGSEYDPATNKGSKDSSWAITGQYLY
jgi:Tfp pilus assembly protein PilE